MAFIETVSPEDAAGDVYDMYARQQGRYGYVPNYAKVFSHRPELMGLWAALLSGIRKHIEPRRFELATLSAAHALKNSACSLAHGQALLPFFSVDEIVAIVQGPASGDLPEMDRAMIAYARKAATDASSINQADIDGLHSVGLSDAEIFDVAITVAARCFFTRVLDALGVEPDSAAGAVDEKLKRSLVVGRAISEEVPEMLNNRPE